MCRSSPPTEEPDAPLVADTEDVDDGDSALNLSVVSSTTSINSSILAYRQENGRTYHAYKEGKYVLPNDETENERLDLQHHLMTLTFDGKLFTSPAGEDKQLHRVLDAGTGTGIWAMDFADEHPESHVVGVDLSPIQPSFVPPNVSFYVDDVEENWTYATKFDLVYIRMMTGSIANWPKLFKQSYENLNPGGWIEVVDITFPALSDDGTLTPDSPFSKWCNLMIEAANNLGRSLESAKSYKEQLEAVGFKNTVQVVHKWPQNTWPRDHKYKELGMWALENISNGLSGLSMALFTRGLGWGADELEVFLADVRKDLRNRHIHSYWPIYVVYAQKPE